MNAKAREDGVSHLRRGFAHLQSGHDDVARTVPAKREAIAENVSLASGGEGAKHSSKTHEQLSTKECHPEHSRTNFAARQTVAKTCGNSAAEDDSGDIQVDIRGAIEADCKPENAGEREKQSTVKSHLYRHVGNNPNLSVRVEFEMARSRESDYAGY